MFAATFSDDFRKLAKGLINKPTEITVSPKNSAAGSVNMHSLWRDERIARDQRRWSNTESGKNRVPLLASPDGGKVSLFPPVRCPKVNASGPRCSIDVSNNGPVSVGL
jgi:hypothetical protein